MTCIFNSSIRKQRGTIIVVVTMFLLLLVGLLGFVVDMGFLAVCRIETMAASNLAGQSGLALQLMNADVEKAKELSDRLVKVNLIANGITTCRKNGKPVVDLACGDSGDKKSVTTNAELTTVTDASRTSKGLRELKIKTEYTGSDFRIIGMIPSVILPKKIAFESTKRLQGLNVAILIDTSGSMYCEYKGGADCPRYPPSKDGNPKDADLNPTTDTDNRKLWAAKNIAKSIIGQLNANVDQLQVLAFNQGAWLINSIGTPFNSAKLNSTVNSLSAYGESNIAEALRVSWQDLETNLFKQSSPANYNIPVVIVLVSDGAISAGTFSFNDIVDASVARNQHYLLYDVMWRSDVEGFYKGKDESLTEWNRERVGENRGFSPLLKIDSDVNVGDKSEIDQDNYDSELRATRALPFNTSKLFYDMTSADPEIIYFQNIRNRWHTLDLDFRAKCSSMERYSYLSAFDATKAFDSSLGGCVSSLSFCVPDCDTNDKLSYTFASPQINKRQFLTERYSDVAVAWSDYIRINAPHTRFAVIGLGDYGESNDTNVQLTERKEDPYQSVERVLTKKDNILARIGLCRTWLKSFYATSGRNVDDTRVAYLDVTAGSGGDQVWGGYYRDKSNDNYSTNAASDRAFCLDRTNERCAVSPIYGRCYNANDAVGWDSTVDLDEQTKIKSIVLSSALKESLR